MIQTNVDLRAFNTFGVPARAERYCLLTDVAQLPQLLRVEDPPTLLLGGGSNLLLGENVPGLTLHVALQGIELLETHAPPTKSNAPVNVAEVCVRVAAGVNWHQFVLYSLKMGWYGLENLALIPGSVGAAPVQNIGAYGVEVAKRIEAVHAFSFATGRQVVLRPGECQFGYRDSRFKQHPGEFLITAVDFRLGGQYTPSSDYGAIRQRLSDLGQQPPYHHPEWIARAVIEIRSEKLPFFSELGNGGSFFKNPVVDQVTYEQLHAANPDLPAYPLADGKGLKLPAGWLIDQAGWRGKRLGQVGCYRGQALVIVNHGGATGAEILAFSRQVQEDVQRRFGVRLEREVQLIGS